MTLERAQEAEGMSTTEALAAGFRFRPKGQAYSMSYPVEPLVISSSPVLETGFGWRVAGSGDHVQTLFDERAGE